eukprot:1161199-Pelagomonas_calceolata.AAC.3
MEEAIDHELTSMVDTFGNLLKAARVPDDEAEGAWHPALYAAHGEELGLQLMDLRAHSKRIQAQHCGGSKPGAPPPPPRCHLSAAPPIIVSMISLKYSKSENNQKLLLRLVLPRCSQHREYCAANRPCSSFRLSSSVFLPIRAGCCMPPMHMQALAVRERKDRAPGDLLEVWAEKLVRSGHTALGLISQLKRGALLSDFESLIARCGKTMQNAAYPAQ